MLIKILAPTLTAEWKAERRVAYVGGWVKIAAINIHMDSTHLPVCQRRPVCQLGTQVSDPILGKMVDGYKV